MSRRSAELVAFWVFAVVFSAAVWWLLGSVVWWFTTSVLAWLER